MRRFYKRIIIILVFSLSLLKCLYSQTSEIPNFIPPSPQASALFSFLDYPVNNSTGLPQITIPIFTIKSGNLSLPISISYHSSGRKVTDQTGSVGLGWVLNCGGIISRASYGKPDEKYKFPFHPKKELQLDNWDSYNYLDSIYNDGLYRTGAFDSEYDIFSFSFGDNSGKFVYRQEEGNYTPVLIPYQPFKVQTNQASNFPDQIVDAEGSIYNFRADEYTELGPGSFQTGADLTSVISANLKDTILLSYVGQKDTSQFPSESYGYSDAFQRYPLSNDDSILIGFHQQHDFWKVQSDFSSYYTQRISQIAFANGKILFVTDGNSKRLKRIEVYNKMNNLIKVFEFNYSFLDRAGVFTTYKLDNLTVKDSSDNIAEKYLFQYTPSSDFQLTDRDFWGYRTASNSFKLIPKYYTIGTVNFAGSTTIHGTLNIGDGGNRAPQTNYSSQGVLKKIVYPTGGSTEFSYEANQISVNGTPVEGPGIRLKQTKTEDNLGHQIVKSYLYPSVGVLPYYPFVPNENNSSYPNIGYNVRESRYWIDLDRSPEAPAIMKCSTGFIRHRDYSSEPNAGLSYFFNVPIFYDEVVEILGTQEENRGKIDYIYSSGNYGSISEYNNPDLSQVGMYSCGSAPYSYAATQLSDSHMPYHVVNYNYWNTPELSSKTTFKNVGKLSNGASKYEMINQKLYYYKIINEGELFGLHIYKYSEFPKDEYGVGVTRYTEREATKNLHIPVFLFSDYSISLGRKLLESTTTIEYGKDSMSSITTEEKFEYNQQNLIKKRVEISSKGDVKSSTYKYPSDLSTALYQNMTSKNILSPVIEQRDSVNNVQTLLTKNNYFSPINNLFVVQDIQVQNRTAPIRTVTKFNKYDTKGNVLELETSKGLKESYLWGYEAEYPVAKVSGADYATISSLINQTLLDSAYKESSNQLQDELNKIRIGTSNTQAQVFTYAYSPIIGMISAVDARNEATNYSYDNFLRLKSLRDNNNNVIKEFHYKEINPIYFNEEKHQLFTRNNCSPNYIATEVVYSVPAGKYSSNVSQTAANQLALNDIATNGQSYANSNGTCFLYKNSEVSQDFTTSCSPNEYGKVIAYMVPYGKYTSNISQADADQKALDDISSNGQSYANFNGGCLSYEQAYKNAAISYTFTKSCSFGYKGGQYVYNIEYGKYASAVSQQDADDKAMNDIFTIGQNLADASPSYSCTLLPTVAISVLNQTHYPASITFQNKAGQSKTYTAPVLSGYTTINVPQDVYNSLDISMSGASSSYSFTFLISNPSTSVHGPTAHFLNVSPSNITIY